MNSLLKSLGVVLGMLTLLLLSGSLVNRVLTTVKESTAIAGQADARIRSGLDNATMWTNSATTTPSAGAPTSYLGTGLASTTLTFASDDISTANVAMIWISSSTIRSFVQILRQASDNNIDFYDYGEGLSPSNSPASTSPLLTWQPSLLNGTSTIVKSINLVPARWTRLIFKLGTTTLITAHDTIGFYANVMGKVPSGGGN